jgi:hypothetical protein
MKAIVLIQSASSSVLRWPLCIIKRHVRDFRIGIYVGGNERRKFECSGYQTPCLGEGSTPETVGVQISGAGRALWRPTTSTTNSLREKKIQLLIAQMFLLTRNKSAGKLQQQLFEES